MPESEGHELRRRMQGPKADRLQDQLLALDSRLGEWADDFVFGQVWSSTTLPDADRLMVAIVALAATEQPRQLRNYLFGALHFGVPAQRIHDSLLLLAVYCGFPTTIEALSVWSDVVSSARRQGLDVELEAGSNGNS